MLGYRSEVIDRLPEASVVSFAGTGNPFLFGDLSPGKRAVDVGCGAGLDTLIAVQQVGPSGQVVAVDMTAETQQGARLIGLAKSMSARASRRPCLWPTASPTWSSATAW
jgi:2-polyprenyl-3-methyl-5-hydroxy-6-metoxy-1,4-benzoquinol methylase